MAGTRINFTKAAIEALPTPPKGKRVYVYDANEKAKGLAVAITDTGNKSFLVYRWVNGRPERITLGRFPSLTIEQARKLAVETNFAIARGDNPAEKKRVDRGEITLEGLFDDYMSRHAEVHNRRPDKARNNYRLYLSHWGKRKLSQIRKSDIHALHAKLGRERGKVTANIAVKLLRTLFNKAIEWDLWDKTNPVKGIKFFPEDSRERFLQPDELPRFFRAVADEENETIRDYILVSLLTGARRSNVLAMRWEQVQLDRKEWRIPVTKSGKPHVVPLPQEVVAILSRRQAARTAAIVNAESKEEAKALSANGFVFPGSGLAGHLIEPKKGWRRILDRAELYELMDWLAAGDKVSKEKSQQLMAEPDFRGALKEARIAVRKLGKDPDAAKLKDIRIHDLRRTMGSWQAATGASLHMIGRTLAHKNVSTTAIYARLILDPVREAMEKATSAMLSAGGVEPVGRVVAMRSRPSGQGA